MDRQNGFRRPEAVVAPPLIGPSRLQAVAENLLDIATEHLQHARVVESMVALVYSDLVEVTALDRALLETAESRAALASSLKDTCESKRASAVVLIAEDWAATREGKCLTVLAQTKQHIFTLRQRYRCIADLPWDAATIKLCGDPLKIYTAEARHDEGMLEILYEGPGAQ